MRAMRQVLLVAVFTLLLVGVLPTSAQDRTLVRFWYGLGGQAGDALLARIAAFNESQDSITVEGVFQQNYAGVQERLQAALVGGDLPELVQLEIHSTYQFASQGALTSMNSFFEGDADFDLADFVPATLLGQSYEDNLYAIPTNRSTPVLYINRDLFTAAGLDPDSPPETWEAFREMGRQLTQVENGETTVYAFAPQPETWYWMAMVWGNGGEFANADVTEMTFAEAGSPVLQMWADMVYEDQTALLISGENAGEQRAQAFLQGQTAMFFASTGFIGRIITESPDFAWDTAFVPFSEGHLRGIPTGGAAVAIPAGASEAGKQAAWEFIRWFSSPEQQIEWSRATGFFPVRQSSIDMLIAEGFYDDAPQYLTAIEQLQFARHAPLTAAWPSMSIEMARGMEEVLVNNVPALDAMTRAQERAQESLNETLP